VILYVVSLLQLDTVQKMKTVYGCYVRIGNEISGNTPIWQLLRVTMEV
jgi:hypothetical protein